MRALLISLIILFSAGVGAETEGPAGRWGFTAGAGGGLVVRREVNPTYTRSRVLMSQLFATARFDRFQLELELGREPSRRTSSGGLTIANDVTTIAAWGRYEFGHSPWLPFAAIGGGAHLDRVRTTFATATDERRGSRRFLGLGLGLGRTLWSHLRVEAEARAQSEETADGLVAGVIGRVGWTF